VLFLLMFLIPPDFPVHSSPHLDICENHIVRISLDWILDSGSGLVLDPFFF